MSVRIKKLSEILIAILFLLYFFKPKVYNIPLHYLFSGIIISFLILIKKYKLDYIFWLFTIYLLAQTLCGYLIFGILTAPDNVNSFLGFALVIGNCILYLIFIPTLQLSNLLNIISLTGLIYIPIMLYECIKRESEGFFRFTGTFEDPNYYGGLIILFITVFLIKIFIAKSKFVIVYWILILSSFLILLFTFSRSVYLSFLVFLIVLFFFYYKNFVRKPLVIFLVFIVSIFSIFIVFKLILPMVNLEPFLKYIEWRFFSESEIAGGMSRLYEILAGCNLFFSEFPLSIIGVGTGSTETHSFFSKYIHYYTINIEPRIHNTFVSILVENGVVGVIIFVFLLKRNYDYINKYGSKYKPFAMSLFFGLLVSSAFVWNLYFLPFFIGVFYIPRLLSKESRCHHEKTEHFTYHFPPSLSSDWRR